VRRFLSYLAAEREVATGMQSQALNALVFLYYEVLEEDLGEIGEFERGKAPKRLPEVLAKSEVRAVLAEMAGTPKLVASLLYGSGLRLSEALRLRRTSASSASV
jgi:site-specific recombinase XerD